MASPSDTIVIIDEEVTQSFEPGGSRPRRGPRRDYSYQGFDSMIVETNTDEADTTPSRKRKRTKTKELSLDINFKELRKAVDHRIKELQEKNRMFLDELHLEREAHKELQEKNRMLLDELHLEREAHNETQVKNRMLLDELHLERDELHLEREAHKQTQITGRLFFVGTWFASHAQHNLECRKFVHYVENHPQDMSNAFLLQDKTCMRGQTEVADTTYVLSSFNPIFSSLGLGIVSGIMKHNLFYREKTPIERYRMATTR
ncbi:uncharacterized protein PGRI_095530 [Penicillium griseofulvum]|uniref:Uncharacterized protein n=1 Tax=Penicillium patulum TaxID=5078 RepID=A0A135LQS3_PENPA|nr:uncharacterized protein PGRI_095530 [Penicillium griseofulvum]KXG51292.1 hypothetical protein PGRI_095530 [Penicillium griseofulvum]